MSSGTKIGCLGLLGMVSGVGLLVFGIVRFPSAWSLSLLGLVISIVGAIGIRASNRASDRADAETKATWNTFKLFYPDGLEVRVGDRVGYRRVFSFGRRELLGRVVYVPGQCAPHPEFDRDGLRWWCAEFDNGRLMAMLFNPYDAFVRRFRLIERGDPEQHRLRPEVEIL